MRLRRHPIFGVHADADRAKVAEHGMGVGGIADFDHDASRRICSALRVSKFPFMASA
jgi:hypothetical protein